MGLKVGRCYLSADWISYSQLIPYSDPEVPVSPRCGVCDSVLLSRVLENLLVLDDLGTIQVSIANYLAEAYTLGVDVDDELAKCLRARRVTDVLGRLATVMSGLEYSVLTLQGRRCIYQNHRARAWSLTHM